MTLPGVTPAGATGTTTGWSPGLAVSSKVTTSLGGKLTGEPLEKLGVMLVSQVPLPVAPPSQESWVPTPVTGILITPLAESLERVKSALEATPARGLTMVKAVVGSEEEKEPAG